MNQGAAVLAHYSSAMSTAAVRIHSQRWKCLSLKPSRLPHIHSLRLTGKCPVICCQKTSQWEPLPSTISPREDGDNLFTKTADLFENLSSESVSEAVEVKKPEEISGTNNQTLLKTMFFRWPMWLLGPSVLLMTGMMPTLWLPLSSVFQGPNIASLLSLVGLDCIFNLGAILFFLMADSCAQPMKVVQECYSKVPFSYQFWNVVAAVVGVIVPSMILFGCQKGFFQPQLPLISFSVLLGPYMLLLFVQVLTEMLTWHWQSPVWLVTPVVYEAYRVLQLMRGLKLGTEMNAPGWMLHTLRGLVCWWVLILGVQLMRVAWFAGASDQTRWGGSAPADG
ncbi:hypothetical protein BT93_G1003 [Corymbia citriodora subsp. variegata]|nr:hypothetical protein BT93_G1003 [Corymbia citriodora subsp. variegata]